MGSKWMWLLGGVVLGYVVAPKLRAWVPALPQVGGR